MCDQLQNYGPLTNNKLQHPVVWHLSVIDSLHSPHALMSPCKNELLYILHILSSKFVFPFYLYSVLWLDMLSIAGSRRLSAFGCQNGCVGLALVNQTGPGKRDKHNVPLRVSTLII